MAGSTRNPWEENYSTEGDSASGAKPWEQSYQEPEKPKRTWGEAIKDTGTQLAEGVNTTLGAIPSVVAPQSKAAGFFRDNAEHWRDKQSDVLKGRIAETDKRIQEAGKDGVMSQIGTAASEYWNDPAQAARLVATNLPSMAATLGTGAAAGFAAKGVAAARGLDAANKAALAAKYGTTTAAATNAALNAGGARGEAFEDLQKSTLAQGMTPEQAEQAGVSGSILPGVVGGVAGAISGKIGLEKAILGQATTGAAMRKAAGAFGAELAGEQIEELAPKVATNYQVGQIDPARGLTDGLGRTMVETAIGSGPGAVVAGGAAGMRSGDQPPVDPATAPGAADPSAPVPPGAAPVEAPDLQATAPATEEAPSPIQPEAVEPAPLMPEQRMAELDERMRFIDQQAKANGWDKRLIDARDETLAELDALRGPAQTEPIAFDAPETDPARQIVKPSVAMGLDPSNGPLTAAAAMSVDSGLGATNAQFLGATGRDVQLRQTGPGVTDESNIIDVDAREVPDQRGIPAARRLANEQEGGALATSSQPLALPAPTNLREGLERIRAQRHEAANAQAAQAPAPAAAPVPGPAPAPAVEANGVKPAGQRQLSADEQAAQDREEARAKELSLPQVLSARLQEAHKAHGRDVKRSVVERSIANEKANNTGTPKAKRERADRIARLEADLALFDEASAMPPKEAAGPATIPATTGVARESQAPEAQQADGVDQWRKSDETNTADFEEAKAIIQVAMATLKNANARQKESKRGSLEWAKSKLEADKAMIEIARSNILAYPFTAGPEYQKRVDNYEAFVKAANELESKIQAATKAPQLTQPITGEGAGVANRAKLQAKQVSPQPKESSESQASQTQQGSTQSTQAGGPQAGAATATASASPAGGNRVQAAGLTDGTPTQNNGAQAAPAPGAQGAAPAESAEQRTQRVAKAGEAWTRMLAAQREALAGIAAGLNPIQRKRVPSAAWADLNLTIQSNLADAMGGREEYGGNSNSTSTNAAPVAINSEAQNTGKDSVRIGRDQTPLSEGGKPFKTRKAAGDAKKLQPMMRVVTVPGGYALAEKTPAQLAAEERAAKRLRTPRTSPAGEPVPAHAFIAASGGLHMRHRNDLGVDGNPRIGNRRLFGGLNSGLSIEQATEMLVADGYLSEGASHNDAYALIKKSLSQPQYNADGIERIAESDSTAMFEDYMAAQEEAAADGDTDPFGMADEFTAEELDEVGYTAADPALQAEVSALIAQAEAMDIDTYAILEDIARTYANATQDEYNAAAREALAAAIARSNSDGGSTAAQAAPAAEPAAEQGLNRPAALTRQALIATENVAPPALELAAQTPAEGPTDSASERFSVGRSLTKAQRQQVLASLVDTYKAKGAQREFKGLDGNGNERYGYIYSPELFEKSDITGAMVRYYVTLPDGRIAHPSELFPEVSASDVERMALEQDTKRNRLDAYENALKPFYSDFASANLMAGQGQVVIEKSGRFAIIPERTGAIGQARQNGWELASPSGQVSEQSADTRAAREQQDGLTSYTAEEAVQRQDEAAQAAKAETARQRAADAQAARDDERKRIAQASVRAADSFELGQDPMDSLTGQGGLMFSRTGAKSPNAQQPTSRAWYDQFVSLLPASYRNDPHRREPLPAEDWNVQRASEVRSKVEALNKQLRGENDRKGYGPISIDGLGNLQVSALDVSVADLDGPIKALAKELGAGIAVTKVRTADIQALQRNGFVPEMSLAPVADRIMGRPFVAPANAYARDAGAQGTIMTYKPRGFPAVLFSFAGARAATADKHALVTAQDRLSAGEDAETVRQETGWHKGADGKWRFEINDADARLKDRTQWTAKIDGINAKRDAALQALWQAKEQRNDFLRARGESPSRISSETKKTPEFKALAKALKNAEAAAEKARDAAFLAQQGDSLITVGDVLSHPALFAAYPEIADVRVDINDSLPANNAAYAYELRAIELSGKSDAQQLLSTLLHEIQHGIQHIEGFAMGGSIESARAMQADAQSNAFNKAQGAWYESRKRWPSAYKSLMDQRMLDGRLYDKYDIKTMDEDGNQRKAIVLAFELRKKISEADKALRSQAQLAYNDAVESELGGFGSDAFNEFNGLYSAVTKAFEGAAETATSVYKRLAGEVEARNTQARQGMTDAQRRSTPPSQTADVADSDVIVTFNGKVMSNAPAPANAAPGGKMSSDSNARNVATQLLVDGLKAKWTRAPEIIVARNMQDAQVPQAVRDYDAELKSQGSDGEARGFIYKGKVYLLSDELKGPEQIAEVLFHEVLGHYGLRGAFGESLTPILQQIGTMRRRDVVAKAREYGLFDKDALGGLDKTTASDSQIWAAMSAKNRLSAAEEVLAEMAQTQPTIGFVQRAIAAIRNWLRANVPGFKSLALTDNDIIQAYILPARGFVTRSKETGAQSLERAMLAFSRDTNEPMTNKNVVGNQGGRSADDNIEGPPPGYVRLFHGGGVGLTEIREGGPGNVFDGLFASASKSSAASHGTGAVYAMDVPEEKILTQHDLSHEIDHEKVSDALRDSFFRLAEEDFDAAYEAVIEDKSHRVDDDDLMRIFGEDSVGEASWAAQRIRGKVAKKLGYQAVEMDDEHGISYLVLPGVTVHQLNEPTASDGSDDTPINFSRAPVAQAPAAAATRGWDAPVQTGFDDVIYKLQDKNIDLKRVVESITKSAGQVADSVNAYLKEELFHKRAAKRVEDFGARELKPLMNQMRLMGLGMEDVEEYLHARHAKEANAVIAQRNPGEPGLQDGGSGMTNQAADNYFAKLDPAQRRKLEAVAKNVDAIIDKTRKLYVSYGLENQDVVDGWASMYQHYIPLMREDKEGGMGTGQGFSVKGKETKGRTGSTRKVVDILANIASQREKLIVRGEKNQVTQALIGLARANPNSDFWEVRSQAPTERVFDPKKGIVVDRPDPLFKSRDNVVVAKVQDSKGNVTEQMVVFNEDNPRAVRMAAAMKNLDAGNLEGLLGMSAKITRYFSAINTQYNPVFGVVNLVRDVQGAMVNLAATPLAGQQGKIARDTVSALIGIYSDIRKTRKGGQASSKWAQLWEQMQDDGGTTGYRELFTTSADRANNLKSILNPQGWMESKWGKVFTADGKLRVPMSMAQKGASEIFGWLSDYNEAMENGVRLAAYKAALDMGMSREQAASLAKNLTVNFNRKGQVGMQAGAVYAFFNAAMQGTARIGQTLFDMDGGDISTLRLSKTGKAVVYGGVTLGVMQALALAGAGFDEEDPPEFVRERSLIIPTGGKTYMSIPMPLGLHVIPGIGRHATEFALSGFDKPAKRALSVIGMFADAFNPIGNAGLSMQTLAPTALDPLVALTENKDWTGKPIARVSFNKALPGHTQWKDTATWYSKMAAEAINWVSGGNEYVAGALSPTPDQIDYLVAQVGGGVAREASKVFQAASTTVNGEELPTYKIPLLGRFAGNAASQASQGTAFYANLDKLNALETEIKGLRKDGRFGEAAQLARENPQAAMIPMANRAERDVQKLRREKRELIATGATREEVRAKEAQITAVMARLNEAAARRKATSPE